VILTFQVFVYESNVCQMIIRTVLGAKQLISENAEHSNSLGAQLKSEIQNILTGYICIKIFSIYIIPRWRDIQLSQEAQTPL
jgi:hypothetical protein